MMKGEQAEISPHAVSPPQLQGQEKQLRRIRSVVGRLIQPRAPHKNMHFWSTGLQHVYR